MKKMLPATVKSCIVLIMVMVFSYLPEQAHAIYIPAGDNVITAEDVASAQRGFSELKWDVSRIVYENKITLYLPKIDGYSWTVRKDIGDYVGIGLHWKQFYDGPGGVNLIMDITNPKGVGFYIIFANDATSTVIIKETFIYFPDSGVVYIPPEERIGVSIDKQGNITNYYDAGDNIIDSNDSRVTDYLEFNPIVNADSSNDIVNNSANDNTPSSNVSPGSSTNSTLPSLSGNIRPIINFSDMTSSHWAYGAVYDLVSVGYIKGYPDGTFLPDANITRAELLAILNALLRDKWIDGAINDYTGIFHDLKDGSHWGYGIICQLLRYIPKEDAIKIFGDKFKPDQKVTREEVVAIIHAILKTNNKVVDSKVGQTVFKDIDESRFRDSIVFCVKKEYVKGYPDGTFRPMGNISRAEIAAILAVVANSLN